MTDAGDNRQSEEDATPADDESLWADVHFWFDAILAVFGDLKALAQAGVTRSLAVKLCNWLWGVEGAVRRLIIAEALKLDPSTLATRRKADAPPRERRSASRRPSFRIFGFNRQGEIEAGQSSARSPAQSPDQSPDQSSAEDRLETRLPDAWHIPFPSDPLLSIGQRRGRTRIASSRRMNLLDRQGRISRFDPDYGFDRDEDYEASLLGFSAGRPARPSRSRPEPLLAQDRPGYLAPRSDLFDWMRVEEEWKRVIPAPHLAARILALSGVMERREQAIHRMARILSRDRERMADILGQRPPQLVWPRRARPVYRCHEVEDLVPRSHVRLWRRDTS